MNWKIKIQYGPWPLKTEEWAGESMKPCSLQQKDTFFSQHITQNQVNIPERQQITALAFSNTSGQMPCKSVVMGPNQHCQMAQSTALSACSLCTWALPTTWETIQLKLPARRAGIKSPPCVPPLKMKSNHMPTLDWGKMIWQGTDLILMTMEPHFPCKGNLSSKFKV